MATPRREGLRIRLFEPKQPKPSKTNSERSKEYREKLKKDPVKYADYKLKYQERNKKNRQKTVTDEELQRRKELNRLRVQRFRANQKKNLLSVNEQTPKKADVAGPVVTRSQRQQEETSIIARRAQWRKHKQAERERWSSQKKRRNRERSLAWYHTNKSQGKISSVSVPSQSAAPDTGKENSVTHVVEDSPPQQDYPNGAESHTTKAAPDTLPQEKAIEPIGKKKMWAEKKALYRAKKALSKFRPNVLQELLKFLVQKTNSCSQHNITDAVKVKTNIQKEIDKLKPKRSLKSLKTKKLLVNLMNDESDEREIGSYQRKKSQANVKLQEFLDDVSVNLPGKKTVSKKTLTQKKILPKRVKHLQKEFEKLNPQIKVSRSTFYRNIPKHILTSGKHKHRSCLCEICVSVDQKLDVLNRHLNVPFDGRDSISDLSLCHEVTLDCLHRVCCHCGLSQVEELIINQLSAEDLQHCVKWHVWENVSKGKKKGPEPVEQTTSLKFLIEKLMQDLTNFSLHLFVFRWQYAQFRLCRMSISTRHSLGLAVLDFAENFTCRPQDEVQSAYYGFSQITVHPSVTYHPCPVPDCSEVVLEYLVFLSDDLNHDAAMAQTILDKTVQHLKARVPDMEQLVVFSDGCSAQYKSKLPFYYISDMKSPVEVVRAYFGSRHGKSPCDACGGVIKRAVEHDIWARQASVKDAKTMFDHCVKAHSLPEVEPPANTCCHTRRVFFLLQKENIDRSMPSRDLVTVPGTRKLHSVRRVQKDVIQTRNLSCFCGPCLDKEENRCINTKYVKPWETIKIKHTVPDMSVGSSSSSEKEHDSDVASDSEDCQEMFNEAFIETVQSPFQKNLSGMSVSREEYFTLLQDRLSACGTYADLCMVVSDVSKTIFSYKLPSIQVRCLYDVGTVDYGALKYLPKGMEYLYPVTTEADGNCVPRAFSMLVFGDQEHHTEIRCRIVHELVTNSKEYLSLGDEVNILCQLSDFYGSGRQAEQVFQLETLDVSHACSFMGLWQIMAAANVFQAPVVSIYPSVTDSKSNSTEPDFYKLFFDRTVMPRNPITKQTLMILWSTTREDISMKHWAANHVVPLMPLTNLDEIVLS